MNIVCDKVLLSAAIDGVSKAVTMRSAIPVLEGILLKAEGFQLNLTGYDLEMGIVTTIEANVKEAGEVVLNAKLLSSMISRMPAGQVSILSAENGKTTIQSGVVQFEIQSMPANDFPELPNTGAEETLTIKTGVLKDMIDRTLYAVSQDEKKPAHTGELFEILPDKLTVGGTGRLPSGHRGTPGDGGKGYPHHRAQQDHDRGRPPAAQRRRRAGAHQRQPPLCGLYGRRLHHHESSDRGRVPQLPQRDPRRQPHPRDHRHQGIHRDHRACFADYYRAF